MCRTKDICQLQVRRTKDVCQQQVCRTKDIYQQQVCRTKDICQQQMCRTKDICQQLVCRTKDIYQQQVCRTKDICQQQVCRTKDICQQQVCRTKDICQQQVRGTKDNCQLPVRGERGVPLLRVCKCAGPRTSVSSNAMHNCFQHPRSYGYKVLRLLATRLRDVTRLYAHKLLVCLCRSLRSGHLSIKTTGHRPDNAVLREKAQSQNVKGM